MAVELYAIGREYVWVPITSSVALDSGSAELAVLDNPTAQPAEGDWDVAVIEPGAAANIFNVGRLIGTAPGTTVTAGDYQVWVRVTVGDEVIIRKSGIVEVL